MQAASRLLVVDGWWWDKMHRLMMAHGDLASADRFMEAHFLRAEPLPSSIIGFTRQNGKSELQRIQAEIAAELHRTQLTFTGRRPRRRESIAAMMQRMALPPTPPPEAAA